MLTNGQATHGRTDERPENTSLSLPIIGGVGYKFADVTYWDTTSLPNLTLTPTLKLLASPLSDIMDDILDAEDNFSSNFYSYRRN